METHSFEDLILKTGLYEVVSIDNKTNTKLLSFLINSDKTHIDMYCVECKKHSTFLLTNKPSESRIERTNWEKTDVPSYLYDYLMKIKSYMFNFNCARNPNHEHNFWFKFNTEGIFKIGQYPSLADIEKNNIEKYKKLLKKDYANLNKAIGLRSHGIGAGSYVYLRRIFENLIEEKHLEAQTEPTWDEAEYTSSRMKEKIKLLEHKLPSILVETPELYGILSKGIHELSEEECLEYFPVTKFAIELILDEKLAILEKESKTKELKVSIGSIASNILK